VKDILLTTINAKWIHPSLALRLLKANLGALEDRCEIIEFALRQPLAEKLEPFTGASVRSGGLTAGAGETARPRILGVSVSIWNHLATLEMLAELEKVWAGQRPVIVLGGPEVSHLPPEAEIFRYADYVIRGEGEATFRALCEKILADGHLCGGTEPVAVTAATPTAATPTAAAPTVAQTAQFINAENVNLSGIKSAYHLYTDEDITKKLIYVEASRGCPFNCEFCLSAVKDRADSEVREFPLEPFLAEMDDLVRRGVKTLKFLDRTFNINIKRACRIMEFFLEKIEQNKSIVVHFEMVPSLFPAALRETVSRFPPGTLRLEIGLQTLNPEIAVRINRAGWQNRSDLQKQSDWLEKELETVRFLREKTNAIIHADLIAGLPGEDLASFGRGFDKLLACLTKTDERAHCGATHRDTARNGAAYCDAMRRGTAHSGTVHCGAMGSGAAGSVEIQIGILKLLPGAPISRCNDAFGMCYNSSPPYEIKETSAMSAADLMRVKNLARFWEIIVNRKLINCDKNQFTFEKFLALSDSLYAQFNKNWGIDKNELFNAVKNFTICGQ
jgi:hypothetical protein